MLQIGLPMEVTNWITGCVSAACYFVLVNGKSTSFFKGGRDIRQGCPLSPILFLLVIEVLSLLINRAKRDGKLDGIEICSRSFLTHLLFVDDVLIFGKGSIQEWKELSKIIKLFCDAFGMEVSTSKPYFLCHGICGEVADQIHSFFPLLLLMWRLV
jgi:hypothetical protein